MNTDLLLKLTGCTGVGAIGIGLIYYGLKSARKSYTSSVTHDEDLTSLADIVDNEIKLLSIQKNSDAVFADFGFYAHPTIDCFFSETHALIKFVNGKVGHELIIKDAKGNEESHSFNPENLRKYPNSLFEHQKHLFKRIKVLTNSLTCDKNGNYQIPFRKGILAEFAVQTYATLKAHIIQTAIPKEWKRMKKRIIDEIDEFNPLWIGNAIVEGVDKRLASH